MRRSISTLTAVLTSSLVATALGILLGIIGLASGEFTVWMAVLTFFTLALVGAWRTAMHYPTNLTFIYILVLITAGSWVSYTVTTLGSTDLGTTYANTDTILITLFQGILGCLVAVQVFDRVSQHNQNSNLPHWLLDLFDRVRVLPWPVILATLGVHFIFLIYMASVGIVISSAEVMGEASTLQSVIFQLSGSISGMITIFGFILFLGGDQRRRLRRLRRLLGVGVLILQFVLTFLLHGRRGVFGFVLLGGLLWAISRGLNIKRMLVMGGILVLVVAVVWPVFLMLRNTAQQEGVHTAMVAERTAILTEATITVIRDFSIKNAYSQEYKENLENRFSFLGWTVMIQERVLDGWETRGGQIFFITLLEMVPRFLWPGKLDYLEHMQLEQKIQGWFRMPEGDGASTLLGYAIADGGWIGVILYFAFFGATLGLIMRFVSTGYFTLSRLWAVGVMFSLCYSIEAGLSEQIGVLRLFVAILLLEWLLRRIMRLRTSFDIRLRTLAVASRSLKET
jgi:hypothetical protein